MNDAQQLLEVIIRHHETEPLAGVSRWESDDDAILLVQMLLYLFVLLLLLTFFSGVAVFVVVVVVSGCRRRCVFVAVFDEDLLYMNICTLVFHLERKVIDF